MVLKWIIGLFKVLNSNQNPLEVAGGVAFGFWLAMIPADNMLWVALFALTFFIKVHSGTEMIFLALFKIIAPLFDGILHPVGYNILNIPALQDLFEKLYNLPLMPFTKFNNSMVMGGFVFGLLMFIPLLILFTILVKMYRNKLMAAIENSKIYKSFMSIPLVSAIAKGVAKAADVAGKAN